MTDVEYLAKRIAAADSVGRSVPVDREVERVDFLIQEILLPDSGNRRRK